MKEWCDSDYDKQNIYVVNYETDNAGILLHIVIYKQTMRGVINGDRNYFLLKHIYLPTVLVSSCYSCFLAVMSAIISTYSYKCCRVFMFKLCYLYLFRHTGVQYGFHIRERSSINSNTSGKNYLPVRIRSPPFVSGIRVAQSLIFFVVLEWCDSDYDKQNIYVVNYETDNAGILLHIVIYKQTMRAYC
jgi:hypothetical protein